MPAFERRDLFQRAVMWPALGVDSNGAPTVGPPQEIAVRWSRTKRDPQQAKEGTIAFDAQAVTATNVPVSSRMWLAPAGTITGQAIATWYGQGSAGVPDDLMVVKQSQWTPDLKARNNRYTLMLMRYRNEVSN